MNPNTPQGSRNSVLIAPNKVEDRKAFIGLDIQQKSLSSENHTSWNEDAMFTGSDGRSFGVLDGVGGQVSGGVASATASKYLKENLQKIREGLSIQDMERQLAEILTGANNEILQEVVKNPKLKGMMTTATIVKIWEGPNGERKAVVGNVGDSRVYIRRANGVLEQVTIDDNLVSQNSKNDKEARAKQAMLNNVVDPLTLNADDMSAFYGRNTITQALGSSRMKSRIEIVDIRVGDRIIVTSDGIHDNLTDVEIGQILSASNNNNDAVEKLIKASLDRSKDVDHPRSKPDDMTVMVVEILNPVLISPEGVRGSDYFEKLISKAEDFGELFKAIDETKGIQGSGKFYEVQELKNLINKVREGKVDIKTITSKYDLRDRVIVLLERERIMRNLGNKPLVADQVDQIPRQKDPAEVYRQKQIDAIKNQIEREKTIEDVLRNGGARMMMSIPEKLGTQGHGGFQNIVTRFKDVKNEEYGKNNLGNDLRAEGNRTLSEIEISTLLKEKGIREIISIKPIMKSVYEDIIIPAQKGYLFGMIGSTEESTQRIKTDRFEPKLHSEVVDGGSSEPIVRFNYYIPSNSNNPWRDLSGRPGQSMIFDLMLPESVAKQLEKLVDKDPTIMRTIVEKMMKEKILKDPTEWEKKQGSGDALRPPYEEWDASPNGGKIYINKSGLSRGFHDEQVRTVKR